MSNCNCNEIENPLCPPATPCDCKVLISSDCVNIFTEDLPCSAIVKGQTLTETILALDTYICERFTSVENFLKLVNIGTGAGVYKGISNIGEKQLKTLLGSNLITLTEGVDEITIAINENTLNTFIEANQKTYSATNIGTGSSIYKDTTVVGDNTQLNLRKIKSSNSSVSIVQGTDDIDITVPAGVIPDATTTVKGIVKLANDLGGTADLPTTPTALHKTTDETFIGIKSSTNTGSSTINGISLINNGTTSGTSSLTISNNNAGKGFISDNSSNGTGIFSTNQSIGNGIVSNNLSTGNGFFSFNQSTGNGIFASNSSNGNGIFLNNQSTGNGISAANISTGNGIFLNNQSIGNGIVSNQSLTGTGFNYVGQNNGTSTFTVDKLGNINANTFVKVGGTPTQYLMADGSTSTINENVQFLLTTSGITLNDSHNNGVFIIDNGGAAITITVPNTITKPGFCVGFIQKGTGDVNFITSGGATITNPIGYKIKGQGYQTFIEKEFNSNNYFLLGNTKI